MLPPRPDAYMCGRHALVVRNAPSRWIASIFFHSANGNASIGWTIWMPALLTRMSTPPHAFTTAATAVFTSASSLTSIAIAIALAPISAATSLAADEVQVGDGDLRAFARIDEGDVLAEAARGAGDDCDLVLQLAAHTTLAPGRGWGLTVAASGRSPVRSNTSTPLAVGFLCSQRGSVRVCVVSAMPAAQCSSIEVRENS